MNWAERTWSASFWLCLFLGISLRLWASTLGHNFDVESYWLVSEIALNGQSVYAETARYNYGPIWYLILGGLRALAVALDLNHILYFHVFIAALLTLVDALIALVLKSNYGTKAALFFFLNPVSILITGYHSQFDNFAILLAVVACSKFAHSGKALDVRRTIAPMSLLGLSLATKHVFLFLPLWFLWAYRAAAFKVKASILICTYGILGLSFLPFLFDPESATGIVENVIKYRGLYGNSLIFRFIGLFVDITFLERYFGLSLMKIIFILIMLGSGIVWAAKCRDKGHSQELFFVYLLTLVGFTSSMANQYLAIPLIALARYRKHSAAWLYTVAATVLLLCSPNNFLGSRFSELKFFAYHHTQIWLVILLVVIWREYRSETCARRALAAPRNTQQ